MNIFRGAVLLTAITIGLSSCAKRPGYDRPMNQQRLHGFHRGGGYGFGPGKYAQTPRYHSTKNYRHYRSH